MVQLSELFVRCTGVRCTPRQSRLGCVIACFVDIATATKGFPTVPDGSSGFPGLP